MIGIIAIALTTFLIIHFTGQKENLNAEIYYQNQVVEVVNLSKEGEDERHIIVEGKHGKVTVAVKHNAVAVVHSNCPEQVCVHTGWVTSSNRSIVCAYNQVSVVVTGGEPDFDVEV